MDEPRFFSNGDHSLEAKVARMAAVFVRLGCSNPTEPSSGRAVSLLHSNFEMTQLGDPQTFYNKVSDFKAAVKSLAKGADQPEVHLTLYSTPDALPPALYQKAYPEGGPAGVRRNSAARSLGPLRKSSSSIRLNTQQAGQQPQLQLPGSSSSVALPNFMMNPGMMQQAMQMNPMLMMQPSFGSFGQMVNAFAGPGSQASSWRPSLTSPRPNKPLLMLQDGTQGSHASSPDESQESQAPAEASKHSQVPEAGKPLSPSEQAKAMLAAWDARKGMNEDVSENDENIMKKPSASLGDNEEEDEASRPMKRPSAVLKKPASKGKGKAKKSMKDSKQGKGNKSGKGNSQSNVKKNGKGKDSAQGNGPKLTSEEKLMWSTKSVGERIKVRPNGCCKCRWKPGCCPSCFK